MTNFEKYKDDIMKLGISDLKLNSGKLYLCKGGCLDCEFNIDGYEDYNEEIEEKIEEMGYDLNDFRFLSCCLCGGN